MIQVGGPSLRGGPDLPWSPLASALRLAFLLVTSFFGITVCVFFCVFLKNDKMDLCQIFIQGLEENTCLLLQPALKSNAPSLYMYLALIEYFMKLKVFKITSRTSTQNDHKKTFSSVHVQVAGRLAVKGCIIRFE